MCRARRRVEMVMGARGEMLASYGLTVVGAQPAWPPGGVRIGGYPVKLTLDSVGCAGGADASTRIAKK